jgi:hypothetical protein
MNTPPNSMADALAKFCLAETERDRRLIAAQVAAMLGRYEVDPVYRAMDRRRRLPRVQRALAQIRDGQRLKRFLELQMAKFNAETSARRAKLGAAND